MIITAIFLTLGMNTAFPQSEKQSFWSFEAGGIADTSTKNIFNFGEYRILPTGKIEYSYNDIIYTNIKLDETLESKLGWALAAGVQYPTDVFTPFGEVSYDHNHNSNFFSWSHTSVDVNAGIKYYMPWEAIQTTQFIFTVNDMFHKERNFDFELQKYFNDHLYANIGADYLPYNHSVNFDGSLGWVL